MVKNGRQNGRQRYIVNQPNFQHILNPTCPSFRRKSESISAA
ncbi:hypothetical protein [Neisseria lisongii]